MIGFFVNTLVLRTDVSDAPSFRELLGRVREACLGAYTYQALPFEKLVEELQLERSLNRHPLFQVFFHFANVDDEAFHVAGLTIETMQRIGAEAKFDLGLYIREQNGCIQCELLYQTPLFESSRMVEMLEQFQYVLWQIVEAPQRPITAYSLVTPKAATLLPQPRAPLLKPLYPSVIARFTTWAQRQPYQPAIAQGNTTWNYAELWHTAKRLAQLLIAKGLEPGDVVAIVGAKSFGLYASMLGVMMSGGVLLTVDPVLPAARRQLMLKEADAHYLLWLEPPPAKADETQREAALRHIVQVEPTTGMAMVSDPHPDLDTIPLPEVSPEDAAYVIFTSGTTGVPKGILGCHKGLSHFLAWQRETFDIGPQDRCTQLTGISFDGVLRDVFLPLTSGACLCVPQEDHLDAAWVLPWLERQQVSILHAIPTLVQAWLAEVPDDLTLRSLRWVFLVGEPLSDTLVRGWREAFPEAGSVVNFYGSTETTLVKCFHVVPEALRPGLQPVGWALPQAQALVLNREGGLCGIGEAGEIVLRTPFGTLGYMNAPEGDQSSLRCNPFRHDVEDRVHYTGDRGRYRTDGTLEVLGRLDHQVKVQGVRVELEEVTVVLGSHEAVQACVVVARSDIRDQSVLVAYVVPEGRYRVTVSELRAYLRRYLPSVMVPSAFVFLSSLPRTPNGKVDRGALPLPDQSRPLLEEGYVGPRTCLEESLCGMWKSVLGLDEVGVFDDFFDLGGHSLQAVQVLSRLREQLAVELPVSALFELPTVAGLACHVEAMGWAMSGMEVGRREGVTGNREWGAF